MNIKFKLKKNVIKFHKRTFFRKSNNIEFYLLYTPLLKVMVVYVEVYGYVGPGSA